MGSAKGDDESSSAVGLRLKREHYKKTKHDSHFTKWQVLIGPTDWEDYALGKEGAARYRVHNLPSGTDSGLYELGIVWSTRLGLGREISKIDADGIVVVYLGQADNVRARLQRYGRSGAHLGKCNESSTKEGPGLFEEIFAKGHSIVFRWAPMKSKKDAEKMESQLLHTFDYAWNKGANGIRRPDDIFQKLNQLPSPTGKLSSIYRKLLPFTQMPVGIKIEGSKPFAQKNKSNAGSVDEEKRNFLLGIFKFSRSRPRVVSSSDNFVNEVESVSSPICGVILKNGSPCRRSPVKGRKRCEEHKGMRIYGVSSKSRTDGKSYDDEIPNSDADLIKYASGDDLNYYTGACGVNLGDGTFCLSQPVAGRKRCTEHKGMRVNAIFSKLAIVEKLQASDIHLEAASISRDRDNPDTSNSRVNTVTLFVKQ